MATRVSASGVRTTTGSAPTSTKPTSTASAGLTALSKSLATGGPVGMSINDQIAKINEMSSALGAKTGKTFQTLTPLTNDPSKIVSSGSVEQDKKTENAMYEAGNRLTGGQQTTNTLSPYQQQLQQMTASGMNMMSEFQQQNMQMVEMQRKALDMTYNANIASQNQQYDTLFKQLASDHQKQVEVAEFNAQSLNPYSQAAGAQTSANFTNEITHKYQGQAIALQQQADVALQQLQAGHFDAYVKMQQNMVTSQQNFQSGMMKFMMDYTKEMESARQFEVQEKRANITNYIDFLSQELPTPQEIEAMTDQQLMSLPAVQQGLRSGYDITGIREDIINASNMQAQELAWETQDRALDTQYKKAQIDNIYDQIADRKNGSGKDEPLTWNEYINMRQGQEGTSFTPSRIEQERRIFFTLYDEKGMPTYDSESLPGDLRQDIIDDAQRGTTDMATFRRYYPEVQEDVLRDLVESASQSNTSSNDGWFNFDWLNPQTNMTQAQKDAMSKGYLANSQF